MIVLFLGACMSQKEPIVQKKADDVEYCTPSTDWTDCLEQKVHVKGSNPRMVMQHPILSSPTGENSHQSYIETDGRQMIVLSSEQNPCSGSFVVTGVLKSISMGGPAGTRGSYSGFYVSSAQFNCMP